jgi:hypothetical protein
VTKAEEELLHALKERYDFERGVFVNKRTLNSRAIEGHRAGTLEKPRRDGAQLAMRIRINRKQYLESHLVWLWHRHRLPKADLEHIDGDPLNSAIDNLREYDHRQRVSARITNKSGHPGVSWDKKTGKWRATIWVNRKAIQPGRYAEYEDAVAARKAAEKEHHRDGN